MADVDIYAIISDALKIPRDEAKWMVNAVAQQEPQMYMMTADEAFQKEVLETAIRIFGDYYTEWAKPQPVLIDAVYRPRTREQERDSLATEVVEMAKLLVIKSRRKD